MCPLPPPPKKNKQTPAFVVRVNCQKVTTRPESSHTLPRPSRGQTPTMKGLCYKGEERPMGICFFFWGCHLTQFDRDQNRPL